MNNEEGATGQRDDAEKKEPSMSVKIGASGWYAIPPSMAEAFRKAGAAVRETREVPETDCER